MVECFAESSGALSFRQFWFFVFIPSFHGFVFAFNTFIGIVQENFSCFFFFLMN